jgi:hypothetical protein
MLLFSRSVQVELGVCGNCYSGAGVVAAATIAQAHHATVGHFLQILQQQNSSCPIHQHNQHNILTSLYKLQENQIYFHNIQDVVLFIMQHLKGIDAPATHLFTSTTAHLNSISPQLYLTPCSSRTSSTHTSPTSSSPVVATRSIMNITAAPVDIALTPSTLTSPSTISDSTPSTLTSPSTISASSPPIDTSSGTSSIISSTTRPKRTRTSTSCNLPNQDSRCFLNAVIQLLVSIPLFVSWMKEHAEQYLLTTVMEQLEQNQLVSEANTTELLNWLDFEVGVHHDVLECIMSIFGQFEAHAAWIDFKATCITTTVAHLVSDRVFMGGEPWTHEIHQDIPYVIPLDCTAGVTVRVTNFFEPTTDVIEMKVMNGDHETTVQATVASCDIVLPAILIISLKRKVYNPETGKSRKCMAKVPSEDEMVLRGVNYTLVNVIAHIGYGVQSGIYIHTHKQHCSFSHSLFLVCVIGHFIAFRRQGDDFIELDDDKAPRTLTSALAHEAFEGKSSQSCMLLYIRS